MGVHMSMGARRQGGEPGVCRVIRASGGRLCRGTAGGRLADAARTGVGEAPRGRGETGSPARRVPALASAKPNGTLPGVTRGRLPAGPSKMVPKPRTGNRMERIVRPGFPKHPGGSAACSARLRHPRASNVSQAARTGHGHSPCAPRLPSGQPPGSARTSFTLSRERAPTAHARLTPSPARAPRGSAFHGGRYRHTYWTPTNPCRCPPDVRKPPTT